VATSVGREDLAVAEVVLKELSLVGLAEDGVLCFPPSGVEEAELRLAEDAFVLLVLEGGEDLQGIQEMEIGLEEGGAEAGEAEDGIELRVGELTGPEGGEGVIELVPGGEEIGEDDLFQGEEAAAMSDTTQFGEDIGLVGRGDIVQGGVPDDEVDGGVLDGGDLTPVGAVHRLRRAVGDGSSRLRGLEEGGARIDHVDPASVLQAQVGELRGGAEDEHGEGSGEGDGEVGEEFSMDHEFLIGGGEVRLHFREHELVGGVVQRN